MPLYRRLTASLNAINGVRTPWHQRLIMRLDDLFHQGLEKINYYDLKAFVRNLPHFIKQAWHWRGFDSHYTIEAFCQNLEKLGSELKRWNNHTGAERNARRCKFAAHLLRKAYAEDYLTSSTSYKKWSENNAIYWEEITEGKHEGLYTMKFKRKYSEEYSTKMFKLMYKQEQELTKQRKIEAWAYIHKYVEFWWD